MRTIHLLLSCLMCVALVAGQGYYGYIPSSGLAAAGHGGAYGQFIVLLLTMILATQLFSLANDATQNPSIVINTGGGGDNGGGGGGGNVPPIINVT